VFDDFKSVIDKKSKEWLGTNMERYLRPDTLFGTKFESYLNQNIVDEPVKQTYQPQPKRSSQLDDLLNKIREEEQNDS
jgi:hypothetical protein